MTTMTPGVTGGVDPHGQAHHAAVLDHLGRQPGDREFPTTPGGYQVLPAWMAGHGQLERVGIDGTGTYGGALSRQLRAADVQVVEVDRPDRKARRARQVRPVGRLLRCPFSAGRYRHRWAQAQGRSRRGDPGAPGGPQRGQGP